MQFIRVLLFLCWLPVFAHAADCASIKVCFTPGESCEQDIISVISNAKSSVYVQAYSFTSTYIANTLIKAQQQGIDVRIILDRSWLKQPDKNRAILSLYKNNIPIWIDNETALAHNKIMIIDKNHVITGSYNFTISAARHNTENVVFISSADITSQYLTNWDTRLKISKPLPAYNKPNSFEQFRREIIKN